MTNHRSIYSEEERAQIAKASSEAQAILNNPVLDEFFRKQTDLAFNAFIALKMGATLDDYQAIHHKMVNLALFKRTLVGHVTDAMSMEDHDRKVIEFEEGMRSKPNI